MPYIRIFRKKDDEEEFFRYWASIATEKLDKDGKGTGKYHRANIPVRMSKDAVKVFEDNMSKTKTKGIKQLNGKIAKAADRSLQQLREKGNEKQKPRHS